MFRELFANCLTKASQFIGNLYLNDPTTPDLLNVIKLPQIGNLNYSVRGFNSNPINVNQARALNCHITLGNCIEMVQKQASSPLTKWAATDVLQVVPEAGSEMNAYYDRRSLRFFHHNFRGKTYYFSDSTDIITHELGHAILDSMRPDFWSVQALEVWSFHEAFSDITAMFHLMNHDSVIEKVLKETKGNLFLSNTISKLAEEVGVLIRNVTKNPTYLPNALRDPAVERYNYINPNSLPKKAENNMLAAECHSFGRVFSNAWYHVFVKTYNHFLSNGKSQIDSFKLSRDVCYSTMMQSIPMSPRVPTYYSAIAKSMVIVSKSKNQHVSEIMKSVFLDWNILKHDEVAVLSDVSYRDVVLDLKRNDVVFKNRNSMVVCKKKNTEVAISELPFIGSLDLKNDVKVEIAYDSYYEFDSSGKLKDQQITTVNEAKTAASEAILAISGDVGPNKMWTIESGRLVRKFIS